MTQVTLKITNLENIQRGISKLGPAVQNVAQADIQEAMQGVVKSYMGGEPGGYSVPERPGQTYQRTGHLGRAMSVSTLHPTGARIVSAADYSQWVIGMADGSRQAWFHAGRWPLLSERVEEVAEKLVVKLDHDTQDTIEAVGL